MLAITVIAVIKFFYTKHHSEQMKTCKTNNSKHVLNSFIQSDPQYSTYSMCSLPVSSLYLALGSAEANVFMKICKVQVKIWFELGINSNEDKQSILHNRFQIPQITI